MIPEEISQSRYVRLVTYRRDGTEVPTPVWAAESGGELLVWTLQDSWKVKRLRRDQRVTVTPCDARGRVAEGASTVEGTGQLLEDAEGLARVRRAIVGRYGWQFRLVDLGGVVRRLGKRPHTGIAVRLDP